jgi:single-strand DNA-binding protein
MYQQIIIVGNLGRDPEMRYTPSGTQVTSLNVATNRKYTGSDGQLVKETTWFRVSVFGKQAEACAQYLKKGSAVLVEGRLTPDKQTGGPRTYTRQDGTVGATYELFANTVRFMSGREGAPGVPGAAPGGLDDDLPVGAEEDIPF